MSNKKVTQNFYLVLVLSMMFLVSTGCVLNNQDADKAVKVDVNKPEVVDQKTEKVEEIADKVDVIETPKKEDDKKELDLSRPFIFKAENGGYGTAEVTGYLTVEDRAGEEKAIFHLVETNSLEFLNFVGKTKEMDLGCAKNLPSAEYTKLLKSNKNNLIKIQIAKTPTLAGAETGDCYTQFRNLKVIE